MLVVDVGVLEEATFWVWVCLDNVPQLLHGAAELAARDRGGERVVRDGDLLVDVRVGEVIRTAGHGTNKDGNRVRLGERGKELGEADGGGVTGEG